MSTNATSVELHWLPPLGTGIVVFNEVCGVCGDDNSMLQYAASATVVNASRNRGDWAPVQAVGTNIRRSQEIVFVPLTHTYHV